MSTPSPPTEPSRRRERRNALAVVAGAGVLGALLSLIVAKTQATPTPQPSCADRPSGWSIAVTGAGSVEADGRTQVENTFVRNCGRAAVGDLQLGFPGTLLARVAVDAVDLPCTLRDDADAATVACGRLDPGDTTQVTVRAHATGRDGDTSALVEIRDGADGRTLGRVGSALQPTPPTPPHRWGPPSDLATFLVGTAWYLWIAVEVVRVRARRHAPAFGGLALWLIAAGQAGVAAGSGRALPGSDWIPVGVGLTVFAVGIAMRLAAELRCDASRGAPCPTHHPETAIGAVLAGVGIGLAWDTWATLAYAVVVLTLAAVPWSRRRQRAVHAPAR